ncbi:metal-sulfur cluster assembly factor [archaeon]|jgi:metal-sulfur cluster biosynthetic enzyme|nr:metal-sulfur cluster assembly factor [archaeon]MBT6698276.1 metal-sulfur cluster assembly factor [archaeon]
MVLTKALERSEQRSTKPKGLSRKEVIAVCKKVEDPELFLDIYTLGLIYEITINDSPKIIEGTKELGPQIHILMTFTTPMCPYGPQMVQELETQLELAGADIEKTSIEITFDPPWKPSEDLRDMMGI